MNRHWRKASRSSQNQNCVELPNTLDAIRDSKNGQILLLSHQSIAHLLITVKHARQEL